MTYKIVNVTYASECSKIGNLWYADMYCNGQLIGSSVGDTPIDAASNAASLANAKNEALHDA